jgi:hypothetical protein
MLGSVKNKKPYSRGIFENCFSFQRMLAWRLGLACFHRDNSKESSQFLKTVGLARCYTGWTYRRIPAFSRKRAAVLEPWRWRLYVHPKHWYLPTTQKANANIFTAVGTWNLIERSIHHRHFAVSNERNWMFGNKKGAYNEKRMSIRMENRCL